MNKDQIEGLAKVFDNLGVAGILAAIAGFIALKAAPWQIGLTSVSGLLSLYAGFCLRKLVPSSGPSLPIAPPSLLVPAPLPLSSSPSLPSSLPTQTPIHAPVDVK